MPPDSFPPVPQEPKGASTSHEAHYCAECDKTQPHEAGKVRVDGLIPMKCTVCGAMSYKLARFNV